jgi:hypothetical protein
MEENKPMTVQDREDIKAILPKLVERVLDELDDSYEFWQMFKPFQEFIVRAAMIGDQTFANAMPSSPVDYDSDDLRELELQAACKRILGSGRFDYYESALDDEAHITKENK